MQAVNVKLFVKACYLLLFPTVVRGKITVVINHSFQCRYEGRCLQTRPKNRVRCIIGAASPLTCSVQVFGDAAPMRHRTSFFELVERHSVINSLLLFVIVGAIKKKTLTFAPTHPRMLLFLVSFLRSCDLHVPQSHYLNGAYFTNV